MGKYGIAAVRAADLAATRGADARHAWERAVGEFFSHASSREKGCPRATFLGLCGAGLLAGVAPDRTGGAAHTKNAAYGIAALDLLPESPDADALSPAALWSAVLARLGEDPTKRSNHQMDIVLALWAAGLVRATPDDRPGGRP